MFQGDHHSYWCDTDHWDVEELKFLKNYLLSFLFLATKEARLCPVALNRNSPNLAIQVRTKAAGQESGHQWLPPPPQCSQGRFSILRVRILLQVSWGWPSRVFITYFQFSALRYKVGLCFLLVRLESKEMWINFVHWIVSGSDTVSLTGNGI